MTLICRGGYGYGAEPLFCTVVQSGGNLSIWCGKRAKREEQNLSFSKHPKILKTIEYWKSYKRFSVGLSDSKKSRYIYHACTMYTIHGYPCMVYMVNVTWKFWIRKSNTKSFVTFSILNRFQNFWMFWKAENLLFTFSTFSTLKR